VKAMKYQYTVITRENSTQCALAPDWWSVHPGWNFMVRTNIKRPDKSGVWLSGGGVTLEEAIREAETSIRCFLSPRARIDQFDSLLIGGESAEVLEGEESLTVIKN